MIPDYTLDLNHRCQLQCFFCPLWQVTTPPKDPAELIVESIKRGTFFQYHPKEARYHIRGGDPLLCKDLLYIVTYLKSQRLHVILWTHGLMDSGYWERVVPMLDQVRLYVPGIGEMYQTVTGKKEWEWCQDVARLLKDRVSLKVVTTVVPETVTELPELYDWVVQEGLSLQIIVPYNQPFSTESKLYIRRYRWVKDVELFYGAVEDEGRCLATWVPKTPWQRMWSLWTNQIFKYLKI